MAFPFWGLFLSLSLSLSYRYWTNEKSPANGRGAGAAAGGTSVGGARHHPSNYHQLKRICRDRGLLFDDPDFPTTARSLYTHKKPANLGGPITWLRPHVLIIQTHFLNFFLSPEYI